MSDENQTQAFLEAVPDPYDLDNLTVSQDYSPLGERELRQIRAKKPHRHDWIRTHPDLETVVMIFEKQYDTAREIYIIARPLHNVLQNDGKLVAIYPYITQDKVLRLWPIRVDEVGKLDGYSETAHDAAKEARKRWIRVASNQKEGIYEIIPMTRFMDDPEWPDLSMKEMLELGFKDKLIDSLEHPAIKDLELGYRDVGV